MKARLIICCLGLASMSFGQVLVNQTPAANGGIMRWSKLWQDPTGQNDLDGDAICYEDFVLDSAASIDHVEWWGDAIPNKGFQIEFWRQDPGTIAYQPIAVFRESGASPEAWFKTTAFSASADPSGTTHYSLDLSTPVDLAANDANNPRWFISIIGLTDVAYLEWNWAQGLGGSTRTFQWVRQTNGPQFRVLGEGRAMLLSATPVPEPSALAALGIAAIAFLRRRRK